jgi:thiol-disulfide isomerase/thioredoxin
VFLARETAAEGEEGASTAPDFTAETLDGTTVTLSELLKKGPVYLDFWTTWCKPCQIALPKLGELHQKYADAGFTLITIASDDQKTVSNVKPHVKSRGWKFPVVIDSKREIGNKYNVRNYPTSFLISPDGKIAKATMGYRPGDEKVIEEEILALLPEGSDSGSEGTKSGSGAGSEEESGSESSGEEKTGSEATGEGGSN